MSKPSWSFFRRTKKIAPLVKSENLLEAARKGNLEVISAFLKKAKNPNILIDGKTTLFHEAAAHGQIEVLKLFLKHKKFKINQLDATGETALYKAAKNNSAHAARLLVASGADVNLSSPIAAAVSEGHTRMVQFLFDQGASNVEDQQKNNLFHYAVSTGSVEIVKALSNLSDEAEFNRIFDSNLQKQAPYSIALSEGNSQMISAVHELMLKNIQLYVKVLNLADSESKTPLDRILQLEDLTLIEKILTEIIGKNITFNPTKLLLKAIKLEKPQVAKLLIEKFEASSACNSYNDPLQEAIKNGLTDLAKYLIAKNREQITRNNDYRKELIILMAEQGNIEIVDSFVENGFDIKKSDILRVAISQHYERTHYHPKESAEDLKKFEDFIGKLLDGRVSLDPSKLGAASFLHFAVIYNNSPKILELLIKAGISPDVRDGDGNTPLMNSYDANAILTLMQFGADIKTTNNSGETIMHKLATHNNGDVVIRELHEAHRKLYEADIDINMKSPTSLETPLHIAAAHSDRNNVLRTLLELGADKEARNSEGETPILVAIRHKNLTGVKILIGENPSIEFTESLIEKADDEEIKTFLENEKAKALEKESEQNKEALLKEAAKSLTTDVQFNAANYAEFLALNNTCLEVLKKSVDLLECSVFVENIQDPIAIISTTGSWSFDKVNAEKLKENPHNREVITWRVEDKNLQQLSDYFKQSQSHLEALHFYATMMLETLTPEQVSEKIETAGDFFRSQLAQLIKEKPSVEELMQKQVELMLQNPPALSTDGVLMSNPYINITTGESREKSEDSASQNFAKNFTLADIINEYRKMRANQALVLSDALKGASADLSEKILTAADENLRPIKDDVEVKEVAAELASRLQKIAAKKASGNDPSESPQSPLQCRKYSQQRDIEPNKKVN